MIQLLFKAREAAGESSFAEVVGIPNIPEKNSSDTPNTANVEAYKIYSGKGLSSISSSTSL